MKKEEAPVYIQHWILIIFGVFIFFAVRSRLQQAGHIESVSARITQLAFDTRFVAIHYPRISKCAQSDSMSKKVFREHMAMLKEEGYSVVGLQDVRDFYYTNHLLPEKSVIILLNGYRDNCKNAVPMMEELGLKATMMVNVRAMRENNNSFISWHDLKKMQKDRHWDFGIVTNSNSDMQEQLTYLHERFKNIRLCCILSPTVYDSVAAIGHEKMLTFTPKNGDGYNSINTDPSSLNVLMVKPQQDRDEFAKLLSNIFSQSSRFEGKFVEDIMQLNWTSTTGKVSIKDGMMELSAGSSRSSAEAWYIGTYDWRDVDLNAKFRVVCGEQFWAYVRFRDDGNYVRFGCNGKRLFLQQRVSKTKVKNLKVFDVNTDFSQFHKIRLIIRDCYAVVYLDDRKLTTRPFRVDDSLVSGKVGFKIWDPLTGVASCQIASTSIRVLPCIALMNMSWDRGTSRCIAEYSDHLSYLCPDGPGLEGDRAESDMEDYRPFLISAAYSGHELTPTIVLNEGDIELKNPDVIVNKLAGLMRKYRFGGLHLDCLDCRSNESLAVLVKVLTKLKTNWPDSTFILSLPPQCYQTCEELLNAADVLVLPYERLDCDFLNKVARPFRLKTLLLVESDKPQDFVENLISSKEAESANDSVSDVIYIVQNYELRGIALCEGKTSPVF